MRHKCKICGSKFYLLKDDKYLVKRKSLFNAPTIYEAFDCPYCGCQNIMNVREVNVEPKLIEVCTYKGEKDERTD